MTAGARSWTDTCVWWPLHRDDLDLWRGSARAVQLLLHGASMALVAAEADADYLAAATAPLVRRVEAVRYPDARGFHGPGAAATLAAAQRDLARATGCRTLVRLDADMVLSGAEWIGSADVAAFGTPGGYYYGIWSMAAALAGMVAEACARHPRDRRPEADGIVDRALVLAAGLGGTTRVTAVAGGIAGFPPGVARITRAVGAGPAG